MTTLNTAWSTIGSALEADQSAINVVATNTADAGIAGYTTKRPELQQADSVSLEGLGLGPASRLRQPIPSATAY